jgi:hypothetical protein
MEHNVLNLNIATHHGDVVARCLQVRTVFEVKTTNEDFPCRFTPVAIYRQAVAYARENKHCSFTVYCNDPCLAYFQLTDLNAPLK